MRVLLGFTFTSCVEILLRYAVSNEYDLIFNRLDKKCNDVKDLDVILKDLKESISSKKMVGSFLKIFNQ